MTVRPTVTPEDAYQIGGKPQKGIVADFQHAGRGLSPWEIEEALTRFEIRGTGVGENPAGRLSFFDTELAAMQKGWDQETREQVEAALMAGMSYGTDYFLSEAPVAAVPYAKYLEHRKVQGRRTIDHAVADIVAAVGAVGIDPALVAAYESDGRNADQHSAAIIAAVQAIGVEPEPEPLMAA